MKRIPFITGSQIYGTPTSKSDIDIVVSGDWELEHCLFTKSEKGDGSLNPIIKFGKLNIIVAKSEDEYDAWWRARDRCIEEKPITRDRAIEIHAEERLGREVT